MDAKPAQAYHLHEPMSWPANMLTFRFIFGSKDRILVLIAKLQAFSAVLASGVTACKEPMKRKFSDLISKK